jgi:hypothetical protein
VKPRTVEFVVHAVTLVVLFCVSVFMAYFWMFAF